MNHVPVVTEQQREDHRQREAKSLRSLIVGLEKEMSRLLNTLDHLRNVEGELLIREQEQRQQLGLGAGGRRATPNPALPGVTKR